MDKNAEFKKTQTSQTNIVINHYDDDTYHIIFKVFPKLKLIKGSSLKSYDYKAG